MNSPELGDVYRDIGPPTAEFLPATGPIMLMMLVFATMPVIGLAACAAALYFAADVGFAMPLFAMKREQADWFKFIMMTALGVVMMGVGVRWLVRKRREFSTRTQLCPGGFVVVRGSTVSVFPWGEIEVIRQESADPERETLPREQVNDTASFLVKRHDGVTFRFGGESMRAHKEFARRLYANAERLGIPWEIHPLGWCLPPSSGPEKYS